jgi:hypothetical protein
VPLNHAKIIMIPKHGKNSTDVASYRPISLLPIISKILEKLLLMRLYSDKYFQAWIPLHQFGFRKAHSTIQQCHRLTYIINKALDDQQYCSAVFLDVSQAFDEVWHQGLLLKFKQTFPPEYFKLLKSYLQNRYFVTTYNNTTSRPLPMLSGVPKVASWVRCCTRYTQQITHNPTQQSSAPSQTIRSSSQLIQTLP